MSKNSRKLFDSQLTNYHTYIAYYNELESLGCNVLNCKLPKEIDKSYFNYKMFYRGALALFYDEVIGSVLALPFENVGRLDIYNRPQKIRVFSKYYSRYLKKGEFVIVWDNLQHKPLFPKIKQCAERLALIRRVIDVNIKQQKTPRIIQCSENERLTIENVLNNVDSCDDYIKGYKNLNIDGINTILAPAPFVSDKLEEEFEKIYSEALRYMGVASVTYEKKERLIKDEVTMSQGGTIANRYSRFNSYKEAFDKANILLADYLHEPLEVEFYDGLPTTLVSPEDEYTEVGDDYE